MVLRYYYIAVTHLLNYFAFSPAPRDPPTHRLNFVLASHSQCFLRSHAPPHMLPNMLHLKSLNLPLQLHHLAAQPWTPLAALWAALPGATLQAAEPAEEHVGRPKGDRSAREAPGKIFARPARRALAVKETIEGPCGGLGKACKNKRP